MNFHRFAASILLVFLLLNLGVIWLNFVPKVNANPTYEDFTTYTEVDPNSRITVTSSRCTGASLTRPESAYVYKDKGANHFSGNWDHKIDVRASVIGVEGIVWGLFFAVGDRNDAMGTNYAIVYFRPTGPTFAFIGLVSGSSFSDVSSTISVNTIYYLRIKRVSYSMFCYIYTSASDRDNEVNIFDTLYSGAKAAIPSFRYIYAMQTLTTAGGGTVSFWSENLDLQEDIGAVTFYNNTGGILRVNNVDVANGTETEYINHTEIELVAIVEGNLTYGFDNFTWNGNYNYSNPYNWTIVYAPGNLTLWCYFGAFEAGGDIITEERAFGTLGFVVAVIAVAIGAAVLGKKLL